VGTKIITWTPDLAIGVEAIDEQHRELFAHVARFLSTVDSGRIEELLDLLHFLGSYVEAHFRAEEDLMRQAGYPEIESHLKEHEAFRAMFRAIVAQFARYGDDPRVGAFAQGEVCTWLDSHVRTTERELGVWLRARRDAQVAQVA
jgi:hemerythrin